MLRMWDNFQKNTGDQDWEATNETVFAYPARLHYICGLGKRFTGTTDEREELFSCELNVSEYI